MVGIELYEHQQDALKRMKNGCILCGGVGSGKSRTALAYYFILHGGKLKPYEKMKQPRDLYIITTARKRDTKEWEEEMVPFLLGRDEDACKVVVDSWNNIKKYSDVYGAFFIFDEQRVVGRGAWVKAFLKIARKNSWILLSATPGDTWMDYVPVFIANGFYKSRTEFDHKHIIYNRFAKYPQVDRFVNQGILQKYRRDILVTMDYEKPAESHNVDVEVEYDRILYKEVFKRRWNIEEERPIQNAAEMCFQLRKVVNSDESRIDAVIDIFNRVGRIIVFYNYNYELDMLKSVDYGRGVKVAEWNGHVHEPLPNSRRWVYLVQYAAGAEGWNCTKTDTIVFFSQNYSYKVMVQASGRIDRLNTPFKDLYFYHLKSKSSIDLAIQKALKEKKKFNENKFVY